jgi:hypothetical protein
MADRSGAWLENLRQRLRRAIAEAEQLRSEASELVADLRNRLHTLTLQRDATRRLDPDVREHPEAPPQQHTERQPGSQSPDS